MHNTLIKTTLAAVFTLASIPAEAKEAPRLDKKSIECINEVLRENYPNTTVSHVENDDQHRFLANSPETKNIDTEVRFPAFDADAFLVMKSGERNSVGGGAHTQHFQGIIGNEASAIAPPTALILDKSLTREQQNELTQKLKQTRDQVDSCLPKPSLLIG